VDTNIIRPILNSFLSGTNSHSSWKASLSDDLIFNLIFDLNNAISFLYQRNIMTIVATKDTIAIGKAQTINSSNDKPPLIAINIPIGFPRTVPELPMFVAITQAIT